MRRPGWTTRRLMAAVAGLAVLLGLSLPAVIIRRNPEPHVHAWVKGLADPITIQRYGPNRYGHGAAFATSYNELTPFWPRYRRYLLGRPWRNQPICGPKAGRLFEACEFDHPEMVRRGGGGISVSIPERIIAESNRLYPGWFEKVTPLISQ